MLPNHPQTTASNHQPREHVELAIIYHDHGGWWSAVAASLQKVLGRNSSHCRLCTLTHHAWGEKPEWRQFCRRFAGRLTVLHAPQCQARLGLIPQTPCILHRRGDGAWKVLIAPWDMPDLQDCEQLLNLLDHRLPQFA